ncbi:MAG: mitochondrial fusion and transport protein ugo1 [Bathelium mastoideum]|nr:MAG: mitochondrial fusion and transport protein ugo1 [Bathelium mastoideum]
MTTSSDVPNPLRPYYVPPSVGLPPNASQSHAGTHGLPASNRAASLPRSKSFGTSARDILSDLDYGDYLPESSPSTTELVKRLANQAVWKYTSVVLAQPFEVAKVVLQCHLATDADARQRPQQKRSRTRSSRSQTSRYPSYPDTSTSSDSSDSEPSYFTSTAPLATAASPPSSRRHTPRSRSATPTPPSHAHHLHHPSSSSQPRKLDIRNPSSILDALAQLWATESAPGLWKATHATFLYQVLLRTLESWTRGLLAALLALPEPVSGLGTTATTVFGAGNGGGGAGGGGGGLDVSARPGASLAVAVTAAGIAACILGPLDMIRTRLILTRTTSPSPPRHVLPALRALPSLVLPISLLPATLLHATLPALAAAAVPLTLHRSVGLDAASTSVSSSVVTFAAGAAELAVRLPLETVLRRGQATTVLKHNAASKSRSERAVGEEDRGELDAVVEVGPYRGVVGTMWYIVREEGSRTGIAELSRRGGGMVRVGEERRRKGQGVAGLWRGWTVGMWGLIGVWGAMGLGAGSGTEGEF